MKFQEIVKPVEAKESDFSGGDIGRDAEEGRVPADRQQTEVIDEKRDFFDHIFTPSDTSALTEIGQRVYREESSFISRHEVLSLSIVDSEEMIPEGNSSSRDLLDWLAERNFIANRINFLEEANEPLFDNVKKHLNLAQLSVVIASQKPYFLECAKRSQ